MNRVFVKTLKWWRVVAVSCVHNESVFQISSNWSPLVDKGWQLPLWFLLFSSSFPKSACPTQAQRRLWCILRFSRFFRTWTLGVALGNVPRWQTDFARLTKHAWSIKTGYHGSVECDGVLIPLHLRLNTGIDPTSDWSRWNLLVYVNVTKV